MRTRRRRSSARIGPFRLNRSGLTRVTSVTMRLPLGRTLVLWERPR
jgi:hypothetical protein